MTGRRRSHGEGSVFKRASDGRWVGRVDVGHVDGQRKRVTVYGATERETLAKLREVVKAKERGQDFTARRRTVGEWLTEWLDDIKATDGTRPLTLRSYRMLARQHIVPAVGSVNLDKLGPGDVRRMIGAMTRAGVGVMTIRQAHGLLRNALGEAERLELVTRNVVRLVRPPAPPARKVRVVEFDEARRLLAAAEGERLAALVVLAVSTGLRRAELLGLRWSDVDPDRGLLRVEQTLLRVDGRLTFERPKSETSDRPFRCRGLRWPRSSSTAPARLRSGRRPGRRGRTSVWSFRPPSARRSSRGTSTGGSTIYGSAPTCRGCGCTTCGTPSRRSCATPART